MPADFDVVYEIADRHLDDLLTLFRDAWWTSRRTREDVVDMLRHTSLVIGIVDRPSDRLVGFCRLLTDFVYRGTVYDVICHPDMRNAGLGRAILEALLAHPRVARIERIDLDCKPEMVGLYAKFGWTVQDPAHLLHMNRWRTPG